MGVVTGGGGGGGGGVTPPVTLTGTNAATVPLTIKAASGQSARTLNIIDALGNDIFNITTNATHLFAGSGGQGGTDFSAVYVSAGVALQDLNGVTKLTVDGNGVNVILPTSDPGIPGQLYSLLGTVHVSA